MNARRISVWDLPTRLFHWLLVLLITAAVISGKVGGGAIEWHGRIGIAILGLLAFRIIWGVIGSTHARFASFFPTPSSVRAYLQGRWQGVGHNPLGAFSVFGLLGKRPAAPPIVFSRGSAIFLLFGRENDGEKTRASVLAKAS